MAKQQYRLTDAKRTVRVNLTLATELWLHAKATGNASAYICKLIAKDARLKVPERGKHMPRKV